MANFLRILVIATVICVVQSTYPYNPLNGKHEKTAFEYTQDELQTMLKNDDENSFIELLTKNEPIGETPEHWKSLFFFEPDPKIIRRGFWLQKIVDFRTSLIGFEMNMDFYHLIVDRLPEGYTPESLFQTIRTGIISPNSDFLDSSYGKFAYYTDSVDRPKYTSSSPEGAMIHIDLGVGISGKNSWANPNVDDATVMVAHYQNSASNKHWIFTTMRDLQNGEHPVTGCRKFGAFQMSNGKWVIFTRGVDRFTGIIDNLGSPVLGGFTIQDNLWSSFIRKTTAWINSHGGSATAQQKITKRMRLQELLERWTDSCYKQTQSDTTVWALGEGKCTRTTWLSCSKNSECTKDSNDPCVGTCLCGYARINECKCVKRPSKPCRSVSILLEEQEEIKPNRTPHSKNNLKSFKNAVIMRGERI